jgi:ABC-type lipoprotein export system ATPase subunit
MIQADGVTKKFLVGSTGIRVVEKVNFSEEPGEFVRILGHSGSGKFTLLYTFAGFVRPTSVKVRTRKRRLVTYENVPKPELDNNMDL